MTSRMLLSLALCVALAVAGRAESQSKCQGSKIKNAAKKALCIAALEAKRVASGTPIDPEKLAKCQDKLTASYAKLESKGQCNTTGDAAAIESKVDAFVADLVTTL